MSAEDLFDMQTAHEIDSSLELVEVGGSARLAELAASCEYDAQIVALLADAQDHLLAAHYGPVHQGKSRP